MKQLSRLFGMALCSCLLLFACTKENGEDNDGNNNGGNNGSTNPGPLFTSVRSILQSNCAVTGCHAGANPQNGINFSINATIIAQKDRIKVRAVDQAGTASQMPAPPNPPLSAANQQAIVNWINAGGRITD